MSREQLFRLFFAAVFLFTFFQLLHMISPFYTGILGAIVITLIFYPLHKVIHRWVGAHRPNASAALSTALVVVLTVVPFIFFSWLLLNELQRIYPMMERLGHTIGDWRQGAAFTEHPLLTQVEARLKGFFDLAQINIEEVAMVIVNGAVGLILSITKKLPKNALLLLINLIVLIFTLFFLLRDGQTIFRKGKDLIPMDEKHKDHIVSQLYLTLTAVVRGVFIVAIAQGTLAGIGFLMAGVPSPVVLGFLTIFASLIPLVGAVVIWLPVGAYYLAQGATGTGIFVLLWGALVVSMIDNFLRPILIGSRARLPILFLFFGILGGIKVYGPMGLFLGPLIVALLIAFIKIYREEYSALAARHEGKP